MIITDDLVPPVDVDEIRLAWKLAEEETKSSKGLGAVMYMDGPPPSPFKPETNLNALSWRLRMLGVLLDAAKQLPEHMPAILREDPLPDVVLRTIADIPMSYAVTGKVNRGWAFDPEELYRRIGVAA